jgi:hypothetical protein
MAANASIAGGILKISPCHRYVKVAFLLLIEGKAMFTRLSVNKNLPKTCQAMASSKLVAPLVFNALLSIARTAGGCSMGEMTFMSAAMSEERSRRQPFARPLMPLSLLPAP